MKRISVIEPRKLLIEEIEKPKAGEGQALVKMVYCGICGSDISAFRGGNPTCKYPIYGLGHEGVGVIEEIGPNDRGLKKGDRVALEPYIPCGKCHMCRQGRFNNCKDLKVTGVHTIGMMSNWFVLPIEKLYRIPDSLSFEEAVLTEPLTIGLHAATRAKVGPGDWVLVFGSGVVGLMSAFAAKKYGGKPILVDIEDQKLEDARHFGFEYTCNSLKEDVVGYLEKVTDGHLADVIIEVTGSPKILGDLHLYCTHGARIALVGWPKAPVEINTIRLMQKEVDIYTSRNSNMKFPESMEFIAAGGLPCSELVTAYTDIEDIQKTMDSMIASPKDYLKVVVRLEDK